MRHPAESASHFPRGKHSFAAEPCARSESGGDASYRTTRSETSSLNKKRRDSAEHNRGRPLGRMDIEARRRSFGRVHFWWIETLRRRKAGIMTRDVLVLLASYADKDTGRAWPSLDELQSRLSVRRNAIQKALRELKDAGIVRVTCRNRRLRQSNLYELAIFGTQFHLGSADRQESVYHVTASDTQKPESGIQKSTDHVSVSPLIQVPGSCSNGANNQPRTYQEPNAQFEKVKANEDADSDGSLNGSANVRRLKELAYSIAEGKRMPNDRTVRETRYE